MSSSQSDGTVSSTPAFSNAALDSARRKVYWRALPLLFLCYVIAYIDRNNVGVVALNIRATLPAFDANIIGFGSGMFFWGYFLLEIPGTLIVERWSARKWICRIMVTWGIVAAMTAFIREPIHFYIIRFLLGLAEAGFFPGVIVYLTHWFPQRDRAKALSIFLIASPIAMIVGNYISGLMVEIGENGNPTFLGLKGWQIVFIFWGIPAVILGFYVLFGLTDRPQQAKWLTDQERDALVNRLAEEKAQHKTVEHLSVWKGLSNPNVLMLALAYFGVVTANYGIEIFLPSILEDWYGLGSSVVTKLAMIPSCLVIAGQLFIGWSSDRFHERRWHAMLPILLGTVGLIGATLTQGNLVLTMVCFTIAATGIKSYMPAFWSLPNMYLTAAAAAGSIGLINSIGNLGGHLGPTIVGKVKVLTGSYDIGIYFLATTCLISSGVIFAMPYIHNRLTNLKTLGSKLQALGAVGLIALAVYLGTTSWVNYQLRPWGPAHPDVVASKAEGQAYFQQLAASLDQWFDKRPKIRDAVKFRLESLEKACNQLSEVPPSHLSDADRQKLITTLQAYTAKLKGLREELDVKVKLAEKNNRFKKTVAEGLADADQLVRELQTSLRSS